MALLHEAVDFKKLDTRMIERNITRGAISRQDYEKSVTELPDDGENAEWISLETILDEEGERDSSRNSSQDAG